MQATPELESSRVGEAPKLNNMPEQNIASKVVSFSTLYKVSQVIGLVLIFSVFGWIIVFRDGFGFSKATIIFNFHPMLMTIAFIYLFANSILHYRTFPNQSKRDLKNHHTIIHGCIIILVIFGGWASYASHIYAIPPIPNFYSLHSWLGIITILLFLSQFTSGFISFLYPGISAQYKEAMMPYHLFFGVLIFVLAAATSVLGFGEKLIFSLNKDYGKFAKEGLFGNFLGVLICIYCALVVFMVTKPEYKRQPKPEDSVLLTGASE